MQVFIWKMQDRLVEEYRSNPKKGRCIIKSVTHYESKIPGKTQYKAYASELSHPKVEKREVFTHKLSSVCEEVEIGSKCYLGEEKYLSFFQLRVLSVSL